jgi:hypothetical protein
LLRNDESVCRRITAPGRQGRRRRTQMRGMRETGRFAAMSKVSVAEHSRHLLLRPRLLQTKLGMKIPHTQTQLELGLTGKNTHKAIHKQHQTYDPFANARGFKYTGTLRASYPEIPVPRRAIPSHIVLPDHAETGVPIAERKIRFLHKIDILTPVEIEGMRKVCRVPAPLLPLSLFWWRLTVGSWRERCSILRLRRYGLGLRRWRLIGYVTKLVLHGIRIPHR